MELKQLEVWDDIYHKYNKFWRNDYSFYFDKIARITKTLIITEGWKRLQNWWFRAIDRNKSRFHWDDIYYFASKEIKEEARILEERYNKIRLFEEKNFTEEEKIKIVDFLWL